MAKKSSNAVSGLASDRKWEIEDDLRTLTRAREIQKDPARMKAVRALAKEKMAALAAMGAAPEKSK